MTKYIIELEDDIKYLIINGKADNRCYTLVRPVDELEVLNSDYINEHFGELQDEAYQRGLNDAWECMKNIAFLNKPCDMRDLFGHLTFEGVLNGYTPSEAIAKLKAYEDKHSDRIEVGDEVLADGYKTVVVAVRDGCENSKAYKCIDADSNVIWRTAASIHKTGKHYDIQSILEAMRT